MARRCWPQTDRSPSRRLYIRGEPPAMLGGRCCGAANSNRDGCDEYRLHACRGTGASPNPPEPCRVGAGRRLAGGGLGYVVRLPSSRRYQH